MLSSLDLACSSNHQRRLRFSTRLLPTRTAIRTSISTVPFATPPRCSPSVTAHLGRVAAFHANSESGEAEKKPREKAEKESSLPPPLRQESLPRHVAIIMDGNSRWAQSRGLPSTAGHAAGYSALKKIVKLSQLWGIRELTVFALSHENWSRPKAEVDFLMVLFERMMQDLIQEYIKQGVRVCAIGDAWRLPETLQRLISEATEMSKNINAQLNLCLAISYSGQRDITGACRRIARKVQKGSLEPEDITEAHFAQELETSNKNSADPDLLIRTSGELRLSNFLLWQSAYTELYFTNVYWPDFDEAHYIEALHSFQSRKRRFGQRLSHSNSIT